MKMVGIFAPAFRVLFCAIYLLTSYQTFTITIVFFSSQDLSAIIVNFKLSVIAFSVSLSIMGLTYTAA